MEMGVGNITFLKDNMSPFDSAGGVAGKEDNEKPVLGQRQAGLEDGNAQTRGQWKIPDMCFIPNL